MTPQTKLYFTAEQVCIGSYDEVTKYEQETRTSYYASEFMTLLPDFNPIGKTFEQIKTEIRQLRRDAFLAKRGMTFETIAWAAECKGLKLVLLDEGDYRIESGTHEVHGDNYCSCLGIAKRKLEAATPVKKGDPHHLKRDNRIHTGEFKNPKAFFIRDGWRLPETDEMLAAIQG